MEKTIKTKDENLIGTKINNWLIIDKQENGKYLVECQCTKKTRRIKDTSQIKNSKSCGCTRMEDLTGRVFGRLTVIGYSHKEKNRRHYWLCQCSCEKQTIKPILRDHLVSGKIQGCGCYMIDRVKDTNKKYNTYDLSGEYGIGYTTKGEEFYFDLEDYDKIKDYCWSRRKDNYIMSGSGGNMKYLHRLVVEAILKKDIVDHINHNTYDNRKENLRVVKQSKNIANSKLRKDNTSGYKGVYWNKKNKNWVAIITSEKQVYKLGTFNNLEEAVKVRKDAEIKYFGEFAYKEERSS